MGVVQLLRFLTKKSHSESSENIGHINKVGAPIKNPAYGRQRIY